MWKPGAGAVKIDIHAKEMTLELDKTSKHKTAVHINLFNKFQRYAINDAQGTVTNIGVYAAPPPPVPKIRLYLTSRQFFNQPRLVKLIHSHIRCVSLSERIAEEIAKQANRNIGFLLQFYHMSVHVDLTYDLFVAVPLPEEEAQKEQDDDEESTCAICLEGLMKDEKLKLLHCPHRFHLECIREWLLKRNSCPLCRETVFQESDNIDYW